MQLANSPRGKTCLKRTMTALSISVAALLFDHNLVSQQLCFHHDTLYVANTLVVCMTSMLVLLVLDNVFHNFLDALEMDSSD